MCLGTLHAAPKAPSAPNSLNTSKRHYDEYGGGCFYGPKHVFDVLNVNVFLTSLWCVCFFTPQSVCLQTDVFFKTIPTVEARGRRGAEGDDGGPRGSHGGPRRRTSCRGGQRGGMAQSGSTAHGPRIDRRWGPQPRALRRPQILELHEIT